MHFNFDFSSAQILWTLTFAALLVLLVVLLGRDRVRRFPWFTISMTLLALRMLISRLLYRRLAIVVSEEVFLTLADLASIAAVLVAAEMARRAFAAAGRRRWIVGMAAVLAVGGGVVAFWGPWPAYKTLLAGSTISVLRVMELFAQKNDLLANVLMIQVGLLVVLFGRYFKANWHSHVQQVVIGLSMASLTDLTIRGTLQYVALHTTIHSQADYKKVMGLINTLNNANSIVFLVVLVWFIACLWIDEPGTEDGEQP